MEHARVSVVTLVVVAVIAVGVAAAIVYFPIVGSGRPPASPEAGRQPLQEVTATPTEVAEQWGSMEEPYPPPGPTWTPWPTPTATPTPQANGLLPPPAGILTDTLTYADPEYGQLLAPLRDALASRDAHALASYVDSVGIEVDGSGLPGGAFVYPATIESTFAELFRNGSAPVIQGFFFYSCLNVYTTGWVGEAELPPWPTDMPYQDRGALGAISGSAYVWHVCSDPAGVTPRIADWHAGNYHQMLLADYTTVVEFINSDSYLQEKYAPVTYHIMLPD